MLIYVWTLYRHVCACSQPHFISHQGRICPISLATQAASLSSAQEPLLLSCLLPGTSLFNRQTTQAQLATPKLPQPMFHLVRIAAKPAIHCCSVTAVQKTLGSQTSDLLCLLYW